jgi:hypothetical protein
LSGVFVRFSSATSADKEQRTFDSGRVLLETNKYPNKVDKDETGFRIVSFCKESKPRKKP